jgi:amidase
MAITDDLAFLDATAQADLVRRKEVKPIELVDAAIERIERLNPTLNAMVTPMYDQAREAANGELPDGPFAGVPFLLKDLIASYAGVRQTGGSAFTSDFVPDHDSELVRRQKRAGLIHVGKSNTPEYGLLPTTEPHFLGAAHNPWDITRTPGGSSGGSASAVAAGLVPMGHANDGGGSIRVPASCCGLFGLKPTRGRNPLGPDVGDMMSGLIMEHAVTRSVRDSAALLDATSGPDVGDPYWAPPAERQFIEEVGADPGKLRIAFSTATPTGTPIHADCADALKDVASLCESLGHEVVEATPEINGDLMMDAFVAVWATGCVWTLDLMGMLTGQTPTADKVEPITWVLYEMGRAMSAVQYLSAVTMLQAISRNVAKFMLDYDVWLTPTLGEPPPVLGSFEMTGDDPTAAIERAAGFVPYTPICNITGQPAASIPLSWNSDGLPIGTHFATRFGDEATIFRLASQLEEARPWADKRPPTSA